MPNPTDLSARSISEFAALAFHGSPDMPRPLFPKHKSCFAAVHSSVSPIVCICFAIPCGLTKKYSLNAMLFARTLHSIVKFASVTSMLPKVVEAK